MGSWERSQYNDCKEAHKYVEATSSFSASIKSMFNRIFRRSTTTKRLTTAPFIYHCSCSQCKGTAEASESKVQSKLHNPNSDILISSLRNSSATQDRGLLHPTSTITLFPKQFFSENQLGHSNLSSDYNLPTPLSSQRFLQCPFCLHITLESEFRQTIIAPGNICRLVQSRSTQTIGEHFDELRFSPEITSMLRQHHHQGSLMTDSGISIGSDKIANALPYNSSSAMFTPCPEVIKSAEMTPEYFHLSNEPPPSPAPEPVSIVTPITTRGIQNSQSQHCTNDFANLVQSFSFSKLTEFPVAQEKSWTSTNQSKTYIENPLYSEYDSTEYTTDEEDYDDDFAAIGNLKKSSNIPSTKGFSIGEVFSCKAISDALQSEQNTQLILSRTRAQIESLLQFSSETRADPINREFLEWNSTRLGDLHNELAILADAKDVINRQMEELKKQYALKMRGKISLPGVDRIQDDFDKATVNQSRLTSTRLSERSYSLDDIRFGEFENGW